MLKYKYCDTESSSGPNECTACRRCDVVHLFLRRVPKIERFKQRFGIEILDGIGSTEILHIFISNRPGAIRRAASASGVSQVPGTRPAQQTARRLPIENEQTIL